jgi:hypothetical protein
VEPQKSARSSVWVLIAPWQQISHGLRVHLVTDRDDDTTVGVLIEKYLATPAARRDNPAASIADSDHRRQRPRMCGRRQA